MNQLLHPQQQQTQQTQQQQTAPLPPSSPSPNILDTTAGSAQEKAQALPPSSSMQPPSEDSIRGLGKMVTQQPQQLGGTNNTSKEASRREPQLETRSFAFPPQPLSQQQQQQQLFGRRDSDAWYNTSSYNGNAQPTTESTAQQQTQHLPSIPSSLFPTAPPAPSSRSSTQFQPASPATLQAAQPPPSSPSPQPPKQTAPPVLPHPHLTLEQTSDGEQLVNAEDINSIKKAINAGDWSYVDHYINSLMQVYSPSLCEYHQKHSGSSARTHQQFISHSLLQLLLKIHQQRYLEALDRNEIPTSVQLLNLMHQFIPLYPEVANKVYTDCYNFFHDRFKFMKFKAETLHVNNMVQYRTVLATEIMSVIVGIPKSVSPTPFASSSGSKQQGKTDQQLPSLLSSNQPAFAGTASAMSVQPKPQVGVVHRYHYENKGGVHHVTQDWQPAPLLSTTPLGTMATSLSPMSAAEIAAAPNMARRASMTAAPVTLIQHPAYHQAATMSQNPQAQPPQPASSSVSSTQQRPSSPHLYSYIHSYEFPPRKNELEGDEVLAEAAAYFEKTPQRAIEPLKLSQKKQKQTPPPVHNVSPEDLPLKKRKRKGKDTGENKAKKPRIVAPITEQLASGEPSPGTQSKANLNLLVQAFNMLSDDEASHSSDGKSSSDGEESVIERKIRLGIQASEGEEDETSTSSVDSSALKIAGDDSLYYSASASSSAASSSNSSTATPPSTPEVHATILRAAETMNPPQKSKKKRRNIITDDTQSEEDDERKPPVDFSTAVAQNTSASAQAPPAPSAAVVAAPAKKSKAKQKKKKTQTQQKKKKTPKVHDDTEILLDTLATTAAATTVDVSELVAQKAATPAQSLMNAKTIKPVKKLCTGGITSTPAIRDRMIKVFEQNKGPVTWEFIQSKVSGNRAKVWATLCMFVNEGLVLQVGKGRRGHPFRYYVLPGVTTEQFQSLEEKFKSMDKESIQIHKQYKAQQKAEQDKKKLEASAPKPAEPSVSNANAIPSISSMLEGKSATSSHSDS